MRQVQLVVLTAILTLIVLPVAADDGFYIGGSIGQADITTGALTDTEVDGDELGAYKVFGGGRFARFFGVEAHYADFGDIEDSRDAERTAEIDGFGGSVVAYLPFGIGDVFGKVGWFAWDAEFQNGGATTAELDGSDPVYGLGLQFRIKSFAIRGEVEYYDVDTAESVYMYSVGASITF